MNNNIHTESNIEPRKHLPVCWLLSVLKPACKGITANNRTSDVQQVMFLKKTFINKKKIETQTSQFEKNKEMHV